MMSFQKMLPARFMPMTMMTGPTTMGGKSFLIFCTPTPLITKEKITYTRPARTRAIMAESARASRLPLCANTVIRPGMNAKLDPRNTGTFRWVRK